jgi:hypothetical protein
MALIEGSHEKVRLIRPVSSRWERPVAFVTPDAKSDENVMDIGPGAVPVLS